MFSYLSISNNYYVHWTGWNCQNQNWMAGNETVGAEVDAQICFWKSWFAKMLHQSMLNRQIRKFFILKKKMLHICLFDNLCNVFTKKICRLKEMYASTIAIQSQPLNQCNDDIYHLPIALKRRYSTEWFAAECGEWPQIRYFEFKSNYLYIA